MSADFVIGAICLIFAKIYLITENFMFMKRCLLVLMMVVAACTFSMAAKKPKTVYVMGVSFSFSDSIVYFTEIQKMDSIVFGEKHKFLPDRQHYSYELSDYMAAKENMPGRPSALLYSDKISKLQKQEAKLKKKLLKNKKAVMYLGNKFSFTRP